MAEFPYTITPQNLSRFFCHIQTAGVPPKVTIKYLQQSGFKSTNDFSILKILEFIGFLDSSHAPTSRWSDYRNRSRSRNVIAEAIREAYGDLFTTYPDAHRKDSEALRNYFSAHTKVGDRALRGITDTFRTLCGLGDFETQISRITEAKPAQISKERILERSETTKGLTLNINIQLQLPATEDISIYDKLFTSLKKNLMSD